VTNEEYLSQIYKLGFIVRYPTRYRVRDETVAAHSFFVSVIVLSLHKEYMFNLEEALIATISHDIIEADTSDIPHDIKARHSELKKILSNIEEVEIKKYPEVVQFGINIFNKNSVEGKIVHLADVIQVSQYIESEMRLGNSTLTDIYVDSQLRQCYLKEDLKPYVRH